MDTININNEISYYNDERLIKFFKWLSTIPLKDGDKIKVEYTLDKLTAKKITKDGEKINLIENYECYTKTVRDMNEKLSIGVKDYTDNDGNMKICSFDVIMPEYKGK